MLLLTLQQSQSAAGSMRKALEECLEDADYDLLLKTVKDGLPFINTQGHHVAIVGAGMAGLTAAKLLREAGYKVGAAGCCCNYVVDHWGAQTLNSSIEHLTCLKVKDYSSTPDCTELSCRFRPNYSCCSSFTLTSCVLELM